MSQQSDNQRYLIPSQANNKLRVAAKIDLFNFKPIGTSQPISTRRSIIASVIVVLIFSAYFIYSFVGFFTNNTPRLNTFTSPINPQINYTVPEFAIAFFRGPNFIQTLNNSDDSVLTISSKQYFKTVDNKGSIYQNPLVLCNQHGYDMSWLGNLTKQKAYSGLYCPLNKTYMKGLLYLSDRAEYPRVDVDVCVNSGTCKPVDEIQNVTSGGRIFMFVRKDPAPNYAKTSQKNSGFIFYNFFIIPQLYTRVDIKCSLEQTTVYPDFFFSFSKTTSKRIIIQGFQTLPSNVSFFNKQSALNINFILQNEIQHVQVVYQNLFDILSNLGAFWGVLVTLFGLYFIYHNRQTFLKSNPSWKEFQQNLNTKQK